jgi:D-glycero-alpha-D-manno-heptose-7-phosphate kinase
MIITKTPLRISFFSGGSDMAAFYQRSPGAALSVTIDKYINVCVHDTPHKGIRIMYDTVEEQNDLESLDHTITRESLRHFDLTKEITVASISDIISKGSGLGSSSTFTVGLAHALAARSNTHLTPRQLAELACDIEISKCGFPIGKQDQYAAAIGGFNLFEFDHHGQVTVTKPAFNQSTIESLERNLVLVYSGISRSASSILKKHNEAMLDDKKFEIIRRGRDKAYEAVEILKGDPSHISDFGKLLHEAWVEKKQWVKEMTLSDLDKIYLHAIESGATGGKILGAGGGGFFLFYVEPSKRADFIEGLNNYSSQLKVYDFKFTWNGSQLHVV